MEEKEIIRGALEAVKLENQNAEWFRYMLKTNDLFYMQFLKTDRFGIWHPTILYSKTVEEGERCGWNLLYELENYRIPVKSINLKV